VIGERFDAAGCIESFAKRIAADLAAPGRAALPGRGKKSLLAPPIAG